ncbi:MAG: hypothetical protein R3A79_01640 [Nannocystaceae bacterium]
MALPQTWTEMRNMVAELPEYHLGFGLITAMDVSDLAPGSPALGGLLLIMVDAALGSLVTEPRADIAELWAMLEATLAEALQGGGLIDPDPAVEIALQAARMVAPPGAEAGLPDVDALSERLDRLVRLRPVTGIEARQMAWAALAGRRADAAQELCAAQPKDDRFDAETRALIRAMATGTRDAEAWAGWLDAHPARISRDQTAWVDLAFAVKAVAPDARDGEIPREVRQTLGGRLA